MKESTELTAPQSSWITRSSSTLAQQEKNKEISMINASPSKQSPSTIVPPVPTGIRSISRVSLAKIRTVCFVREMSASSEMDINQMLSSSLLLFSILQEFPQPTTERFIVVQDSLDPHLGSVFLVPSLMILLLIERVTLPTLKRRKPVLHVPTGK